jgi:hypothetical protein
MIRELAISQTKNKKLFLFLVKFCGSPHNPKIQIDDKIKISYIMKKVRSSEESLIYLQD